MIPAWIPLLPRTLRRGLTEGLLRARAGRVRRAFSRVARRGARPGVFSAQISPSAATGGRSSQRLADRGLVLVFAGLARAGFDRLADVDAPVSEAAGELSRRRSPVHSGSWSWGARVRWASRIGPGFRSDRSSPGGWAEAIPARRFECEILAWLGDSLEKQHRKLAALKRRPEMVIIYSGHNEFAARYEEERDGWLDEEPGNGLIQPIYRASLNSPFCRLAYEIISKNRLDVAAAAPGRHQLIDPPQCSPAEAEEIRIDFEGRLEAHHGLLRTDRGRAGA